MLKTKDFEKAIDRITEFPNSHGFSKEEYEAIINLQNRIKEIRDKFQANIKMLPNGLFKGLEVVNFSLKLFSQNLERTKFVMNDNWYISFNLISRLSINELVDMLNNKDELKFQNFILDIFPKEKENIFDKMKKTVPHRVKIIEEIEYLFDKEIYSSVIVMAYTQVDGICNENLGYGFFDTDNKSYKLKISSLQPGDGLASKIAYQLKAEKNEITRFVKLEIENRTFKIDSYNRHLVMHGHSLNYGSKINAMRAISLLDFICTLKSEGVMNNTN